MNPFTRDEFTIISKAYHTGHLEEAWEACTAPLHQLLVAAQSFDYLDTLLPVPRLILILDYLEGQVGQGGFIQLFQNGYAPLLLEGAELLQELQLAPKLVVVFDESLRLFSMYISELGKETSVAEFARLYDQFPQFQPLEINFQNQLPNLKEQLVAAIVLAGGPDSR